MKLKRIALIVVLSGVIPVAAVAADSGIPVGHTNFVGTISAMRVETGQLIPVLTLDRALSVDGKQRSHISLTMVSRPGAPKRPVLGDSDPFAKWSGKRVRVEGELARSKRGTTPKFHVTSIEAEK